MSREPPMELMELAVDVLLGAYRELV
jgi:hypothetical protein